jgi:GNAT superfamily N-acetyltransferase
MRPFAAFVADSATADAEAAMLARTNALKKAQAVDLNILDVPTRADVEERLKSLGRARLPAGVEIRIADAATATSFGGTVQAGFGVAPECAEWFAALVGRPGWYCFLATIDGEPAAAAAMFIRDGAAWSGMSTTLPDCRGRGLQSALIDARLNEAAARGVTWVTSETRQPSVEDEPGFSSYRNQKRGGFERAYIRLNLKRAD